MEFHIGRIMSVIGLLTHNGGVRMKNKNIIIMLVVIIVVLAAIIGFAVLNPMYAKEPTKIKITSNKTLTEGDSFSLQLTDLNKTALSKQKVNISVKNSKGKVVLNKTVKTNDFECDIPSAVWSKGKYNVTVSYGGNENYTANNTTQNLTIKEKVAEAQITSSSSNGASSEPSDWYDSRGAHHFYKNGQEYVGDPNAQHMTIEMSEYVSKHGMGD